MGEKIKKVRLKNNLSQTRFAKRIGVSGKSISAYETNKALPSIKVLGKIEKYFRVSLMELPYTNKEEISKHLSDVLNSINCLRETLQQLYI
ncbi:helix-turn-helix transcriptional regulator [candidate division WWE3 bacterium]|nr:helix-turn-helix transcriptional regulator [candidate division WWE3 bacterium]